MPGTARGDAVGLGDGQVGPGHVGDRDGGVIGLQPRPVLHVVGDGGGIFREADVGEEGDVARAVHLPEALAWHNESRLLARRRGVEIDRARVHVVVGIGVVAGHVQGHRPRRIVQRAVVDRHRRELDVVHRHRGRVRRVAVVVLHRVLDGRRVPGEARRRCKGNGAGGGVHAPGALAGHHQGNSRRRRADDLHRRGNGRIARGVVAQHGHGHRRARGVAAGAVVRWPRARSRS